MDCHHIPEAPYTDFINKIMKEAVERRVPVSGSMELTGRCNLSCAHCYFGYGATGKEMGYADVCRVIDTVCNEGCLWMLFTGGEPLLRPDFSDIYLYARRKGLFVTLFTNGTLVTPRIADLLKEYPPTSVEITVYGATKDTYEKVTGVAGSFERCMEGIRLILERGLRLELKTMVLTLNKHELGAMKGMARSLGVEFRFDPIVNPGLDGSAAPCRVRLSARDVAELDATDEDRVEIWRQYCAKFKKPVYSDRLFVCGAGAGAFHVDPYGNLHICGLYRAAPHDLLKKAFSDGWYGLFPAMTGRRLPAGHKCSTCDLRAICESCPGTSYLETGNAETAVEYLCDIAHMRARALGFGKLDNKQREAEDEEESLCQAGSKTGQAGPPAGGIGSV